MIGYILLWISIIVFLITAVVVTRTYMKCTIKRCDSTVSMKGKVIIVTGSNTGLGFYAARDLAKRGGRVILACRDESKGTAARDQIIAETGNRDVIYKHLNLSSLKSVRKFVEGVIKTETRLDVLVNNAGALGGRMTEDKIVEGMQINHFAPFLLTLLLLPLLRKSKSRIVNVSSLCHYRGEVKFDKINKFGAYNDNLIYANSKLCSVIFTKELARRLHNTDVTVNALHPGVILTNIVSTDAPIATRFLFKIWCWFCCRTPEEGAQTIIYLSVADEVEKVSGEYFVDCKPRFMLWKAHDKKLAKELWEYSEKLVGISDEENTAK